MGTIVHIVPRKSIGRIAEHRYEGHLKPLTQDCIGVVAELYLRRIHIVNPCG